MSAWKLLCGRSRRGAALDLRCARSRHRRQQRTTTAGGRSVGSGAWTLRRRHAAESGTTERGNETREDREVKRFRHRDSKKAGGMTGKETVLDPASRSAKVPGRAHTQAQSTARSQRAGGKGGHAADAMKPVTSDEGTRQLLKKKGTLAGVHPRSFRAARARRSSSLPRGRKRPDLGSAWRRQHFSPHSGPLWPKWSTLAERSESSTDRRRKRELKRRARDKRGDLHARHTQRSEEGSLLTVRGRSRKEARRSSRKENRLSKV